MCKELRVSPFAESPAPARSAGDLGAVELVDAYREGDGFFSSGSCTLLGKELAPLDFASAGSEPPKSLAAHVTRALKLSRGSVVMGALPFDSELQPRLVVPRHVRRAGPLAAAPRRWYARFDSASVLRSVPSPQAYRDAVSRALSLIEAKQLTKVVVARSLELEWREPIEVSALLKALLARRRGMGFAMDLGAAAKNELRRRTLFGISPELLVRRRGPFVSSQPLAGSAPRHDDPVQDGRVAQQLLASEKDRREHAVVVEAVVDCLRQHCSTVEHAAEPSLVQTETLWHLGTEIRGVLRNSATTSLELALSLHPTPAVCGHPLSAARQAIALLEPFPRGFFAGAVGWCDARGDGEWAVTIRAGEVEETRLRLYAGAGIVAGSDPALELAETSAKLNTLLRILGVPCDSQGTDS